MRETWEVAMWDQSERPILLLLNLPLFEGLPNGTILHSINGETAVKGKDDIDLDTRGGFIAWGIQVEHDRDPIGRQHIYGYELA